MSKLSFKMKLGLGFGALLVLLIAVSLTAYLEIGSLAETADQVDGMMVKKDLTSRIDASIEKQTTGVRGFLLAGREDLLAHDEEGKRAYHEASDRLEKTLVSEKGKKTLAEIGKDYDEFRAIADHEIQLRRSGKSQEAVELAFNPRTAEVRNALRKSVAELESLEEQLKQQIVEEQGKKQAQARILVVIFAVAGVLIGTLIATLIARSVNGTIGSMVGLIQEIAGNNLAIQDIAIASQDELGQAGSSLNSMKNNLREIMQSIAGTAEHVASASEEISASATQTASGSDTQKDQVHQVATAMQEMSATVHEVSENCNKAAESAHKASQTAREGGAIVEDTLTLMRSIADSVRESAKSVQELGSRSDQIGKIVGVIDDIADQTNLLALNAAIEAARAGEQGRGFAVVADEVRKLAERTTKATKEIAEMIQSVQTETRGAVDKMQSGTQQVEKGVEVTAKAGASLKQIIGQAEHVGEMVTHIATAANEQSSATEQVNNNMEQISKLVAESAEGARQSAKACEQLSGLAFELQSLVSRFKLGNGAAASGYRPRQAKADAGRVRTALALAPPPVVQHVFQHAGHDHDGE